MRSCLVPLYAAKFAIDFELKHSPKRIVAAAVREILGKPTQRTCFGKILPSFFERPPGREFDHLRPCEFRNPATSHAFSRQMNRHVSRRHIPEIVGTFC